MAEVLQQRRERADEAKRAPRHPLVPRQRIQCFRPPMAAGHHVFTVFTASAELRSMRRPTSRPQPQTEGQRNPRYRSLLKTSRDSR